MCKKILYVLVMSLGLIGIASADEFGDEGSYDAAGYNPGFYFGGQIGTSNMHYSGSSYTTASSSYEDGWQFAFRGYIGHAFSEFLSAELGYDYYGKPKFKNTDGNTQDILQHGFDLVAKATLPLDYGFGFYAKGGLAWVLRSKLNSNNNSFADKSSNNTFTPVIGLGFNYWFAPNMAFDFSWTKTLTVSDLPTIDLYTVGFVYRINI